MTHLVDAVDRIFGFEPGDIVADHIPTRRELAQLAEFGSAGVGHLLARLEPMMWVLAGEIAEAMEVLRTASPVEATEMIDGLELLLRAEDDLEFKLPRQIVHGQAADWQALLTLALHYLAQNPSQRHLQNVARKLELEVECAKLAEPERREFIDAHAALSPVRAAADKIAKQLLEHAFPATGRLGNRELRNLVAEVLHLAAFCGFYTESAAFCEGPEGISV